MTNRNVIAIDGPAASGKGTLARRVAEKLNYAHMDTGLLYRAVAHMVLESGDHHNDAAAAIRAAGALAETRTIPFPEETLKAEKVTEAASFVASMPDVRRILLEMQKSFAASPPPPYEGAVLDGRDIGTVICPEAPVKMFITAALENRAERRFKELQSKGLDATYEAVLRDMRLRDERDATRSSSPMRAAADAVTLDTTALNQDQVLEKAMEFVRARLSFA